MMPTVSESGPPGFTSPASTMTGRALKSTLMLATKGWYWSYYS